MLRNLCVGTLICGAIVAPCANAEEVANANPPPIAQASPSASSNQSTQDLYMLCAFYPKPGTCEGVYREAMSDSSISAEAVRAEYAGYARYLGGTENLTDSDRQYLRENDIMVPNDLSVVNQSGLHNVINDATLSADAKRAAVNNFVSRAVEAELYCGFNSCEGQAEQTASSATSMMR